MPHDHDIYDLRFIERLFDDMAGSYEAVNFVSSFGFSHRWRQQLVTRAGLQPGDTVCDLMCGMGECWPAITGALGGQGTLIGLDISAQMLAGASRQRRRFPSLEVDLRREDVLHNSLPDRSVDRIVSGFGLKTLSNAQFAELAQTTRRLLRPGGTFAFVDVSVPADRALRRAYLLYLRRAIPIVGRALLGNPHTYRMLGIYAERFGDSRPVHAAMLAAGLEAHYDVYFQGCATGVSGRLPTGLADTGK